jgi:hypothetical protein
MRSWSAARRRVPFPPRDPPSNTSTPHRRPYSRAAPRATDRRVCKPGVFCGWGKGHR